MSSSPAPAAEAICRAELDRLHSFVVAWMTGEVEESADLLQQEFSSRLSPDFQLINPSGQLVSKELLTTSLLESGYESRSPENFEIYVHNFQLLQNMTEELVLVVYEEWQRLATETTARRVTAILKLTDNHRIEWKHVHETWLQGRAPTSAAAMFTPTDEETAAAQAPSKKPVSLISSRRHVSQDLSNFAALPIMSISTKELVGINIRRVEIETTQGPMAAEEWLDTTTATLEKLAQYKLPDGTIPRRRRFNLPEICFPHASLIIRPKKGVQISFTAIGALEQWSRAHANIEPGSSDEACGVTVMQSVDAALWEDKGQVTDFHFDWGYCTPYSCSLSGGGVTWQERPATGMQMNLLTDQSQPILYFDEVQLLEDDLHDNGVANFKIKLRVMPTCLYVLSRFWLRVDEVVLKCRETRLMVIFGSDESKPTTTYRDITWRQCSWKDLPKHNLPTDVRAWKNEGTSETAEWQALVNRLPVVTSLPDGILPHVELVATDDMKIE